jgi:hypothetical protein
MSKVAMTASIPYIVCLLAACSALSGALHLPDFEISSGVRVFHPAFPTFVTDPISISEAKELSKVKETLKPRGSTPNPDLSGLPWKVLPQLGISEKQNVWSRSQIVEEYEKNRHNGYIVWAHKLKKPEKGCMLLNHWSQRAVLLTDYDVERGAKGYEVRGQSGAVNFLSWPPFSLEMELTEKVSRWQPVRVSDNISSGEVLSCLPGMMTKAPWELIFLLTLSPEENKDTLQALFDTGLCPRQGLIAYLRLLEQVQQRAEAWDGVPQYRKITENEIII